MHKHQQRKLRHHRVRAHVTGSKARPRLSVFRSLTHIYAQVIDDAEGKTLAAADSKELKTKGKKSELASAVGTLVAQKAQQAGIKQVVFDRGGYQYQGRIKQLADAARAAGLEF